MVPMRVVILEVAPLQKTGRCRWPQALSVPTHFALEEELTDIRVSESHWVGSKLAGCVFCVSDHILRRLPESTQKSAVAEVILNAVSLSISGFSNSSALPAKL